MKRVLTMLMVTVLVVAFAATGYAEEKEYTIGVCFCAWNNPFAQAVYDGIEEKIAQHADVEFILLDGEDDPVKQADQIDGLIQQNVDCIILQPSISDSLITACEKINDAGIPLLLFDRKMYQRDSDIYWECLVDWDMQLAGIINAQQVAEAVGNEGKIVVVEGELGTSTMEERGGAFYDALAEYPDVEIVYTVQGDFARAKGMEVTQDVLARLQPGSFDAIYYMSDEMCLGGLEAIKAADRLGEFKIISCDGSAECMEAMRNGEIDYEVAAIPKYNGVVIDVAVDVVKGTFSTENEYYFGDELIPWDEEGWEGFPHLEALCYGVDSENMNDPLFAGY